MDKMLEFNDVELYYDHVYALRTVEVRNKRWKFVTFLKASKRAEKRANRK